MSTLNHSVTTKPASRAGLLLITTTFLFVSFLTGCRKHTPRPGPAVLAPSPVVSRQPSERTADEIALLDAAIKGDTAAVKALLDRGVNVNTRDPDGRTPLTEAAYYGHTEIARLLLDHGADIFAKKVRGETVSDMAAGHQDIAQMIKREQELLDAAAKNDVKRIRELLDTGAYVNVRDPEGRTPLTEAVWNNNAELVRLLLDRGANANSKKNDGATPLSIAQGKGYREIVQLLQKSGAK